MITGITVENFKSIEGKEVIKFNDLTFFIGPNNSGKSTAINVLDFLNTLLKANPTLGALISNGMNSNKILGKYGDAQSIINCKNKKKDLFSLGISFHMEEFKKEMTATFTFDKKGSLVQYTLHDSDTKILEFHENGDAEQYFKINYSYILEELNNRFTVTRFLFILKEELNKYISDKYGEDLELIKLDIDQEIKNILSKSILENNDLLNPAKEKDLFTQKYKIDKTVYRDWILSCESLMENKSVYSFLNEYTVDLNNPIIQQLNRKKEFKELVGYLISYIESEIEEVIEKRGNDYASEIESYSEEFIKHFESEYGFEFDEFDLSISVDADELINKALKKERSDVFKMSFIDYYGRNINLGSHHFYKKDKEVIQTVEENTSAHYFDFKGLTDYLKSSNPKILIYFIKKYLGIKSNVITDNPLFVDKINEEINIYIFNILSNKYLGSNESALSDLIKTEMILNDDSFYKDYWFDDLSEIELSTIFSFNLIRLNRFRNLTNGEKVYRLDKDFNRMLKGTLSADEIRHYSYSLLNDSINSCLTISEKRFFLSLFALLHMYENKDNERLYDAKDNSIPEDHLVSNLEFIKPFFQWDQNLGHESERFPYKIKVLTKYATHWMKSANSIVDKYMLNFDFLLGRLKQVHFLSIRYSDFGRSHLLSGNDFLTTLILAIEKYPKKEEIYNTVNSYLKKLELADAIFVEMDRPADIYKIYLEKDGKRILLSDFGHGTKRILPILIQLSYLKMQYDTHDWWRSRDQFSSTFFLEEPELGLHPHLQSEFIALIAENILTRRGISRISYSRFILETHSEYLIRKLQYLCFKNHALAKFIDIYYFSKESPNQRIMNIKIATDGTLSSEFGKGFFDEADNLAIELLLLKASHGN